MLRVSRTRPAQVRSALVGPQAQRGRFVPRVASTDRPVPVVPDEESQKPLPVLEDPWEDAKWTKYKWTGDQPQNPFLRAFHLEPVQLTTMIIP